SCGNPTPTKQSSGPSEVDPMIGALVATPQINPDRTGNPKRPHTSWVLSPPPSSPSLRVVSGPPNLTSRLSTSPTISPRSPRSGRGSSFWGGVRGRGVVTVGSLSFP